jgi:2Fe-2S ferredoxin
VSAKHRVRVEPSGIVIEVDSGEALMTCAVRSGHTWPTVCGGRAECTACFVHLLEGTDTQAEPEHRRETVALELVRLRFPQERAETIRLACQLELSGDAVVYKPGVRKLT